MTDSILNLRGQLPSSKNEDDNTNPFGSGEAFSSVLYYCALILFMPIVSFFATKVLVLEGIFHYDSDAISSNVISAIVSVIVLHLALGLYIYKAYFEGTQPKKRLGKQE